MITTSLLSQAFQSAAITPQTRVLGTDTSLVSLNIKTTTGGTAPKAGGLLRVYFATSSFPVSAGAAPAALKRQASMMEVPIASAGAQVLCFQSPPELVLGANFYLWSDVPSLDQSITLEVDLVEI